MKNYDWAVMDTMTGELEFLTDEDYNSKCADEHYNNTHFSISRLVYEEYGVKEVFKKKVDVSGLIPLVDALEADYNDAVENEDYESAGEIKEVLDRWYEELNEEFNI